MNTLKFTISIIVLYFLCTSFKRVEVTTADLERIHYHKIVERMIWAESRGKHYAKSHLKGKKRAYTRWQVNGHGLQYFNTFSRLYKTNVSTNYPMVFSEKLRHHLMKVTTNRKRIQYSMWDIRKDHGKADVVGHWILRTIIKHYKKKRPKFWLIYSLNAYNCGYGWTAKYKFNAHYLKQIAPWEFHLFETQHRKVWQKGNIIRYSRRNYSRKKVKHVKITA